MTPETKYPDFLRVRDTQRTVWFSHFSDSWDNFKMCKQPFMNCAAGRMVTVNSVSGDIGKSP